MPKTPRRSDPRRDFIELHDNHMESLIRVNRAGNAESTVSISMDGVHRGQPRIKVSHNRQFPQNVRQFPSFEHQLSDSDPAADPSLGSPGFQSSTNKTANYARTGAMTSSSLL
uniref:Uncharacterized protein n=1 Tax=Panagrellus redivivus TaxID=6233 RepID=A0A7E4VBX0_PANRE